MGLRLACGLGLGLGLGCGCGLGLRLGCGLGLEGKAHGEDVEHRGHRACEEYGLGVGARGRG